MQLIRFTYIIAAMSFFSCKSDDIAIPVELGIGDLQVFDTHRTAEIGWESLDKKIMSGTLYLPPDQGTYPAVMFHFGSNAWSRSDISFSLIKGWMDNGFAVLAYDKRGVGRSQGVCCPWQDPDYFELLGQDVLTGIRLISEHPEIREDAVGAYGFSQGGWVLPVAAALSAEDIAFLVIGSGTTVTLGEELLYSELTGENDCNETNLSQEEINNQLEDAGPSLFDPYPFLEQMNTPSLWVFGEKDLSIPVNRSIEILDELAGERNKPFEYLVIEGANHSWIIGGAICQTTGGVMANPFPEIFEWLKDKVD